MSRDSDTSMTILGLFETRLADRPDEPAVERLIDGSWQPMTVREFYDEVISTAKGLIKIGIKPGDRVAIMSRTRYEWTLLDYAIGAVGATSVPIYESSSVDQIKWICKDANVKHAFVEGRAYRSKVKSATGDKATVWVINDGAINKLQNAGARIFDWRIKRRQKLILAREIPATIVYTSGTTGRPKGTVLTHGNFTDFARDIMSDVGATSINDVFNVPGRRTLLFLPLAHVMARFAQVFSLSAHTVIGHCPDIKDLTPLLATFKPTFLLAVPRVLEKVYAAAEAKAGRGLKLRIFRHAVRVAIAYSRALDYGKPGTRLRVQRWACDRLVYRNLKKAVGGAVEYIATGGAPLNARMGHFFRGAGFMTLEGYGLTETVGSVLGNAPARQKYGSVGLPLLGVEVKIANDSEVLVRGPSVFKKYHNDPGQTAAAFMPDGWFKTGDLGQLDRDGYLYITGRKKNIIVTSGGKNVAPEPLENNVCEYSLIGHCVVVGDGQKHIAAMITIDQDVIPAWAQRNGLPSTDWTVEAVMRSPIAQKKIKEAIKRANVKVSNAEAIKRVAILSDDFTEANDCLTPSLKLKRGRIIKRFADVVETLYDKRRSDPEGCVIIDVK